MSGSDRGASVNRQEILERIEELKPALRQRAQQCEAERRVPDATVAQFKAMGLHLVGVPKRFGGLGLELEVAFMASIEAGRACGSSAWMVSQWPMHNWFVGLFSEQAQREVWDANRDALSSTASALRESRITPVDGGFRISGRWMLSSGIDHADWLILMNTGDPTGALMTALVPRADFEIVDDWFVMGLRGTGSKSLVIEDAFVPEHRGLSREAFFTAGLRAAAAPGSAEMYKCPPMAIYPWTLACPLLGMVQGMVDEVALQLPHRRKALTGKPQVEEEAFQIRFSEAAALVDAALLLFRESMRAMLTQASSGAPATPLEVARLGRNRGFALWMAARSAELLFDCAGGGALYENNPIQRLYRDAKSASRHSANNVEDALIPFAARTFGVELPPPFAAPGAVKPPPAKLEQQAS